MQGLLPFYPMNLAGICPCLQTQTKPMPATLHGLFSWFASVTVRVSTGRISTFLRMQCRTLTVGSPPITSNAAISNSPLSPA